MQIYNSKSNQYNNNTVNFYGFKSKLLKIAPRFLVKSNEIQTDTLDIRKNVSIMMKKKNIGDLLIGNTKFAEENYSKEGQSVIQRFCKNFPAYLKDMSQQDHIDIMSIYKTSNPKNIKVRLEILDKFGNRCPQKSDNKSEIHSMRKLFDKMDSDKHVANFVNKALGDDIRVETVAELHKIMDIVPPKKAEIFHRNISRIVRLTNIQERPKALMENSENPFFDNPRTHKKTTLSTRTYKKLNYFEIVGKFIENKINIKRYKKLVKTEPEMRQHTGFAMINVPVLENVLSSQDTGVYNGLKLVKTLKPSPSAKKLSVLSDINNIIKQKLGQKTFEKQQNVYSNKATAIKLKLLPEIFESISATRKTQKLNGQKPTVNNSDALKLYEKIQGKNKKLVRYMLKQTDENNNRIFNVKDIINVIENAENNIALKKESDPEFKAKNAKEYYDNIHSLMTEKYGKLTKTKSKQI